MKASHFFKSKPGKPIDILIERITSNTLIIQEEQIEPIHIDREKILKKIIEEKEKK